MATEVVYSEGKLATDEGVLIDLDALSYAEGVQLANTYADAGSYQPVAADLELDAAAGSTDGSDPSFVGSVMGNLIGGDLTADANYLGGVIGHITVTSTASSYPSGAVLAGVGDGTSDTGIHGVVAYIDGDSAQTIGGAAFKVMHQNSTAGSGFHFGLDLNADSHDGFDAVGFLSAPIRLPGEVCILTKNGAPVDGTSGDGAAVAAPGSLLSDYSGKKLYVNTGTKASPTWTVAGSQS